MTDARVLFVKTKLGNISIFSIALDKRAQRPLKIAIVAEIRDDCLLGFDLINITKVAAPICNITELLFFPCHSFDKSTPNGEGELNYAFVEADIKWGSQAIEGNMRMSQTRIPRYHRKTLGAVAVDHQSSKKTGN